MKTAKKMLLAQQRAQAIEMFGNGITNKHQIARQTGASRANVMYWLKVAFPNHNKKREKKQLHEKALSLHNSGRYTGTAIALMLGVKERTVTRWVREAGSYSMTKKRAIIERLHTGSKFDIQEIADLLGCAKYTVQRYIKDFEAKKTYQPHINSTGIKEKQPFRGLRLKKNNG
ncbi:MAG: helix-turn-helix domain-containing protein [Bacteroidetes bacterium]|nr:helix-turn-helix domain-containing protein [Bacteroidota bacterium]